MNPKLVRRCILLIPFVGIAFLTGCGETYTLVPAEGVVKIDGKPAKNISLQFLPQGPNAGPTSYATTDDEGKFKLMTTDGKNGAVFGKHKVILVDNDEERPAQGATANRAPRLSDTYAIATKGLDAEVTGSTPIILNATGPKQ